MGWAALRAEGYKKEFGVVKITTSFLPHTQQRYYEQVGNGP